MVQAADNSFFGCGNNPCAVRQSSCLSATRFSHALMGDTIMSSLLRLCSILPVILCASLVACASGGSHENFMNIMQLQVGKSTDNPYLTRNRYPDRRVDSRVLQNGNVEEEFQAGHKLRCRVFFEIDNKAAKIVGWRYEGSSEDCAIVP